ncbi:MAG: hypothetical protein ACXWHF_04020 [Chthoniobacterales bacterium]
MTGRLLLALTLFAFVEIRAAEVHPIVELNNGYLLGTFSDGKWLNGEKTAPLFDTEATFRIFGFTEQMGEAVCAKPISAGEPCPETQLVELSVQRQPGSVIAIACSWNPMPRVPRLADTTQPVYIAAVRDFLAAHGLPKAEVKITRIVRVDLDGDGEDEVLISATNYHQRSDRIPSSTPNGSYSIVLLRRVVHGKVETQMIAGEIYPAKKEFNAPNEYKILSVLDCDGDGKLEVILESSYYEGGATTIYGFKGRKIEELVSVACGA